MKTKIISISVSVSVLFAVAFAGICCSKNKYPQGLYAELHTSKGIIVLELEFEKTPMTVANFVGLAEGKIENAALPLGTPYFDGTPFHRVVPEHVIQAGTPAGSNQDGPGFAFPNEIHPELRHSEAGILGMANGGPHTNSSQFYITLSDRSYLDGDYTVFGKVIEGMPIVFQIEQGDIIHKVTIVRVGKAAGKFQPDTAFFQDLVEKARKRIIREEEEKSNRESAYVQKNWPDTMESEPGIRFAVTKPGTGNKAGEGKRLKVKYSGQFMDGRKFRSTAISGNPAWGEEPEAFDFITGKDRINPGVDKTLLDMKKGEIRVVILSPDQAYGTSGYYGPRQEGRKRFVISPNTRLMYEIELLDILD